MSFFHASSHLNIPFSLATKRTPWEGPRKAGGKYYSGDKDQEYTVIWIEKGKVKVRYSDGSTEIHSVAWDDKKDHVVKQAL